MKCNNRNGYYCSDMLRKFDSKMIHRESIQLALAGWENVHDMREQRAAACVVPSQLQPTILSETFFHPVACPTYKTGMLWRDGDQ